MLLILVPQNKERSLPPYANNNGVSAHSEQPLLSIQAYAASSSLTLIHEKTSRLLSLHSE